ncbi:hypothetical protein BS17DRAFT_684687, partial [Gyrodon lividus]
PTIHNGVIKIIKEKIRAGIHKPSGTAYRSHWFCIVKKDEKSLHIVHDLQPLNGVIIHNTSVLPFVEHLAESFMDYVVYGMLDLFVGYD